MITPLDITPIPTPPMTTPQTPEPPAAGELSDREILELMPQEFRNDLAEVCRLASDRGCAVNVAGVIRNCLNYGALTHCRAAIAADRAQRSRQEGQMAEALRRLWGWTGISYSWDARVVADVGRWIDAGMVGDLPPLPEYIARREEQSNG